MSAKFTKGPWHVRKDENGNTVVATMPEPSDILPGATQSWHLAIVMGTPGKRDKQANANVMAAAPLLYEALAGLEWSQSNHHRCCPACGRATGTGHFDDCKLNNALRAARGEG